MTIIAREMDAKEKTRWQNHVSRVRKLAFHHPLQAIIEGLLYIAGEDGLKLDQLLAVLESDVSEVQKALDAIICKYRQADYGFELVRYADTYRFVTKDYLYPYARKLLNEDRNANLSQSALETLAIIAYKQPITRIEIEEIRGVGCDVMLKKLIDRQLVKEVGRSQAPGRPILYEVTAEFMNSFKLNDLKDLPDLPQFGNDEKTLFEYE